MSHFAHSSFVASFEPQDVRNAFSHSNYVNSMHEELDFFFEKLGLGFDATSFELPSHRYKMGFQNTSKVRMGW
jgi:hypothetical protein